MQGFRFLASVIDGKYNLRDSASVRGSKWADTYIKETTQECIIIGTAKSWSKELRAENDQKDTKVKQMEK